MVDDLSQHTAPSPNSAKSGPAKPRQAVAGLMAPQTGEALIREEFPTIVAVAGGLCRLCERLMKTIVLAPLAWLLLAPVFLLRIAPFVCKRYTLTNRRLIIRRGITARPGPEVPLAEIDDVRLVEASKEAFYNSADLDIYSGDRVKMTLKGVPEPESFRHAILNAVKAWVPGKAKGPFLPASAKV
jgi:hypothetical protein